MPRVGKLGTSYLYPTHTQCSQGQESTRALVQGEGELGEAKVVVVVVVVDVVAFFLSIRWTVGYFL